ncbi:GNAT family N-acetyltransferase [Saccharomonospora xinjiangensis]|nr:succinyl-CoA synthetase subunit alpha [Saccharomonospora xinjiangensis]
MQDFLPCHAAGLPGQTGADMSSPATGGGPVRALLADGRIVEVRPLSAGDLDRLRRLHSGLTERDRYFRFFTSRPANLDALLRRLVSSTGAEHEHAALGAFLGDDLVGMAHYEPVAGSDEAEVAFVVDHRQQAHGVGTLLLEHLASLARRRGVRRFVAEVLAENTAMLRVFRDIGMPLTANPAGDSYHVVLDLHDGYPAPWEERERTADVASLRPLLRPGSVAVVGAGRRRGSLGNAVLHNILASGFTGACYPVNPRASTIEGLPALPSAADLPSDVDLAVLCVPAEAVPGAAEDCGRRGVKALLVLTSGITQRAELAEALLSAVRGHGMRLVGPNCLGVANTEAAVRCNATFTATEPPKGRIGVVTQSGGMGIAVQEQLAAVGLGVSTMVSTGDKYDVSGNDLLLWWQRDPATDLAVLYLESFGNPRKFAVLARSLAMIKPVLTVRTGTSDTARRAAASHSAAAATPAVVRDALFEQGGVMAVDTLTELVAVASVLSWQPLPHGDRVGVVTNVGGGGVVAADAFARRGLRLPELSRSTTETLSALLPPFAGLANPVDTTAGVDAETFQRCLAAVLADPGIGAVLAITVPTALGDPAEGLADAVAETSNAKPLLAVRLGQLSMVTPLRPTRGGRPVPVFGDPADAAGALATISRYARWRSRPKGDVPDLPGIDPTAARAVVATRLADDPRGGWLPPAAVHALLDAFGLPVVRGVEVGGTDGADGAVAADATVAAADSLGYPVVVKAVAEGLVHKSRGGGVLLGLGDRAQVRAAVATLRDRFGPALGGVFVQPMAQRGRELLVGVSHDPTFGPLVTVGLGGVDTDLIADRAFRLLPLTDRDAMDALAELRSAPAIFGEDAEHPLPTGAIVDVLLRVGRLAELLPEVAELDLNPVIVHADGCDVVDARVRVRSRNSGDPFLRRLRA